MSKYEKTDVPNMVIDPATGAVLNTDMGGYMAVKKAREEHRRMLGMVDQLENLRNQMLDILDRIESAEVVMRAVQDDIAELKRKIDP